MLSKRRYGGAQFLLFVAPLLSLLPGTMVLSFSCPAWRIWRRDKPSKLSGAGKDQQIRQERVISHPPVSSFSTVVLLQPTCDRRRVPDSLKGRLQGPAADGSGLAICRSKEVTFPIVSWRHRELFLKDITVSCSIYFPSSRCDRIQQSIITDSAGICRSYRQEMAIPPGVSKKAGATSARMPSQVFPWRSSSPTRMHGTHWSYEPCKASRIEWPSFRIAMVGDDL